MLRVSQLIGFGSSRLPPKAKGAEYVHYQRIASSLSTFTFSGVPLGQPDANRRIVVAVVNRDSGGGVPPAQSSVTIAGVACTSLASIQDSGGGGGDPRLQIWISNTTVPNGWTGDITVVTANTETECAVIVWAVYGLSSSTPHDTMTDSGATTNLTGVIDLPAGGVIIAAAAMMGGTHTWSGPATKVVEMDNNSGASASNLSVQLNATVAVNGGGNTQNVLAAVTLT
jgi:hypothetical protein